MIHAIKSIRLFTPNRYSRRFEVSFLVFEICVALANIESMGGGKYSSPDLYIIRESNVIINHWTL